jgi:hypothetical protein
LCDLYHRIYIGHEQSIRRCSVFSTDARVRVSSEFPLAAFRKVLYNRIKTFYTVLNLDTRDGITGFQDVPIIRISKQGYKRSLDEAIGGDYAKDTEYEDDVESTMGLME